MERLRKIVIDAVERLLEFLPRNQIQLRNRLLRIRNRLQQIIALPRQERKPLLALVVLLQRHHVHRAHRFDARLHLTIIRLRDRQLFPPDEGGLRRDQVLRLRVHRRHASLAQETAFISGEELAMAETNYREMKARVESMGAVNMMALEEYNECEQRFTFLTRERDDLLQSIADTQQAIAELDLVSREKFEQAFNSINHNFSEAFHTIFGGGTAERRLTQPASSGDPGFTVL